jgi:glycosyltransferase involved in cell wall biosynthesis
MTSPKIVAVMPAYNESKTVGAQVTALLPHVTQVVVVDDCSHDGTGDIAKRAGAHVMRREVNGGYDRTLNDGFKAAAALGADIIFTFDADGEHDAADVPRMIGPILRDEADIVVGMRPDARHWGESILALMTRTFFGIPDPICGFKAYSRKVYDAVGFFDSVGSIGTELMIRGSRRGFRLISLPITLHARLNDRSRFYSLDVRGNLKVLRAMCRVLFVR